MQTSPLSSIDRKILLLLQHNADLSAAEIAEKVKKAIEPPTVAKKTKGQRRRDKWAVIQAREAYRAANSSN